MPLSPLLVSPIAVFAITVLLHVCALRLFPRWKLLDFPERYGLTRARLPYPTGIIAVLVFLCMLPALMQPSMEMAGLAGAILLLAVFCCIDDRTPLPPVVRFIIQIACAVLLIMSGIRIDAVTNPLPWIFSGGSIFLDHGWLLVFSVIFTIIWLLLTINALNWFDGITGQVSTISTIGFLTIGFLSLSDRVNQPALALIAFTLAAIAASALCFDFPPARVLMGDTGAMFFGLMIGILTIYSGGKVATAFLVLGVPLIDLLFVIIRRIHRRQSLLHGNASDQHLHHRLLARGWSKRQIIFLTAAIGTCFGITALFLSTGGKIIASGILFLVMIGLSIYSTPRRQVS